MYIVMSYPIFRCVAGRSCRIAWLLLMFISSYGNVRLPAVLGSDMVLQQRSEVKLWGWGEPNEKVTVTTSWDNKTYTAVAVTGNADWMATNRRTVPASRDTVRCALRDGPSYGHWG